MLEILLLVNLARRIGKIVQAKGHPKVKYQTLLVCLWIVGEFIGALLGANISKSFGTPAIITYLFALLGAAVAAWGAFWIAKNLPTVAVDGTQLPPRPLLTPWIAISGCAFALILGNLLFQISWNPLFILLRTLKLNAQIAQILVTVITFIGYLGLAGFALGGVFTGWTRQKAWTGRFILASFVVSLIFLGLPLIFTYSTLLYAFIWGIIGALIAALFGWLVRDQPEYRGSSPLLRLLVFGFVGYFLALFLNVWVWNTFIDNSRFIALIGPAWSAIIGLLEGSLLGLGLELPRLFHPAIVDAPTQAAG